MSFRKVVELVVTNDIDCEIARIEVHADADRMVDLQDIKNASNRDLVQTLSTLSIGDTITIVERDTEV